MYHSHTGKMREAGKVSYVAKVLLLLSVPCFGLNQKLFLCLAFGVVFYHDNVSNSIMVSIMYSQLEVHFYGNAPPGIVMYWNECQCCENCVYDNLGFFCDAGPRVAVCFFCVSTFCRSCIWRSDLPVYRQALSQKTAASKRDLNCGRRCGGTSFVVPQTFSRVGPALGWHHDELR
jgi:hypothetical protein